MCPIIKVLSYLLSLRVVDVTFLGIFIVNFKRIYKSINIGTKYKKALC